MRSECLYLGRDNLPSEDELCEAYKQVAEIMGLEQDKIPLWVCESEV